MRNLKASDICIVSVARTPIGSFNGSLSKIKATVLGALAIEAAIKKLKSKNPNVNESQVQEVYMGNVLSAGLGQNPARQAAMFAHLPTDCCCTTINKVCASGMKAITIGAQQLQLKCSDQLIVCGGFENMSQVPYYLPEFRNGKRMLNGKVIDGMVFDGLTDVYNEFHMGVCAEICSDKYSISRSEQDDYAIQSFKRSRYAQANNLFDHEIIEVEVPTYPGKKLSIKADEGCTKFDEGKLKNLKPAFKHEKFPKSKQYSVTAGNASTIADGAASVVLCTGEYAMKHGLDVEGVIVSYADAEVAPVEFPTSPVHAVRKALDKIGLTVKDIDFFEINEAFSVVVLANMKLLGLQDTSTVNILGGGVSLGHPIGCSGARIICTLLSVLKQKNAHRGVAAICNGGGGSTAVVIERVTSNAAMKSNL